jgi:uncharacterized protein YccT (UPF0319 family)
MACAPTGPIRFYPGPPQPTEKLAIVSVPGPLSVLSIDGQTIKSPSQETGSYDLQLPPGHHLIAFRYDLYWGTTETGMMVKSKPTGVDAVFEAGKTYEIRYKVPRNADEASNYLTDFAATLIDQSTGQQYSSYEIRDLNKALAAKKINQGMSASTQIANPAPVVAGSNPVLNADSAVKEDPVKRLKFWWLMANAQERKQFTEWMKTATESFAPAPAKTSETIKEIKP